jgi:uncharacterized protein YoxC/small-conductance mechanosensitive channel
MGQAFGAAIAAVAFAALFFLVLQVIYRFVYWLLSLLQDVVSGRNRQAAAAPVAPPPVLALPALPALAALPPGPALAAPPAPATTWQDRFKRWFGLVAWWRRLHTPVFGLLGLFAGVRVGLLAVYHLNPGGLVDALYGVLDLAMIVVGTWGLVVTFLAAVDSLLQIGGKPQTKRLVRAQITAIQNLLPIAAGLIIIVGALVIVNAWQPVSQVVLGAAVVGALIAAVTNSSTLGNIFASTIATVGGILAVGDAVDLGPNEAGEVKEITLTHARLQVNDRRDIWVPMNQFVTQRFHHLVRTVKHTETNPANYNLTAPPNDREFAWVFWTMDLDWGVNVASLRQYLLYNYSDHGIRVQVVGFAGTTVQVRIWMLADPSDLGSRQHTLREVVNRYLATHQPEAVPGARLEGKVDRIANEMNGLSNRVQAVANEMNGLGNQVGAVANQMNGLGTQVQAVANEMNGLGTQVQGVATQTRQVAGALVQGVAAQVRQVAAALVYQARQGGQGGDSSSDDDSQ